ncbi:MAG: hypothetical protein U0521_16690 [Anaerolineae bacterium]
MRRVLRRHRLPHPYRLGLTVLWVTPLLLFVGVIALKRGVDLALLDPRFLLPALLMIAPPSISGARASTCCPTASSAASTCRATSHSRRWRAGTTTAAPTVTC